MLQKEQVEQSSNIGWLIALIVTGLLVTMTASFAAVVAPDVLHHLGLMGCILVTTSFFILLSVSGHLLLKLRDGVALFVGLLLVFEIFSGTLLLCYDVVYQKNRHIHAITEKTLSNLEEQFIVHWHFNLTVLSQVARYWQIGHRPPAQTWRQHATSALSVFPGVEAIVWLNTSGKVRQFTTRDRGALMHAIEQEMQQPLQRRLQALARSSDTLTASHNFKFNQGQHIFLIYYPVFLHNKFDGFLVGVLNVERLFDTVFSQELAVDYNILVQDHTGQVVYSRGTVTPQSLERWGESSTLWLQNKKWQISVSPTQVMLWQSSTNMPWLLMMMGLMVVLLVMLFVGFTVALRRRARCLEEANDDLQAEISERQAISRDKEMLEEALLRSQKLQAVGTLAGGIAHNFNNLLYSIIGYIELTREDLADESLQHKNLGKALTAAKRGKELVKGILSFSHQQPLDYTIFPFVEVMHGTLSLLRSTLSARITIDDQVAVGDRKIRGNFTQLQQVFVNIIKNAVDAMDGFGTIYVLASYGKLELSVARFYPNLKPGCYFHVKIKDTGVGMDERTRQRIFEPFFTTKDIGKGTGLGLSTAFAIIEDHSGKIMVESEAGRGTTFHIILPECQK